MVASGGVGRLAALVMACCTAVALAGCSTSTPPGTARTSAEDPPPPGVNLARLADIADDFPADYLVNAGTVHQEQAEYIDLVGTTISSGMPLSVDPPQCRALLEPVRGTVGADYIRVRGDGPGPDEQTIVVSANDRVSVPAEIPATGCERMTFQVEGAIPDGAAERLPGPEITGATTFATRIDYGPGASPVYYYMAILDGGVYVQVDARVDTGLDARNVLPDLLVEAVAAVRQPKSALPPTPGVSNGGDLAHLSSLVDQFPPGFTAVPFQQRITSQGAVDSVGAVVPAGGRLTVDPPRCKVLLKPVEGRAGAQSIATSASGAGEQRIGLGADDHVTVPTPIPATGCERMSYRVDGDTRDRPAVAVERVAAPQIHDATTVALKSTAKGYSYCDYSYLAVLDEGVLVHVNARLRPDVQADPMLSALLGKAVAAVRAE